ncbi:hypothetical protein GH714_014731 [Hevea brasiliensis]|uniref:Phospholipid/glycerol acyltransferase domain-containing protein n=1 Tax=Hevea brasiliensis TaxID=3981 RepID=A0A6A6KNS7_HEVBR|nr:hypothetical protein GH714_014731 [Hevea brasiliensis]
MVILKLADWVSLSELLANSWYRATRKMRSYGYLLKNPSQKSSQQQAQLFSNVSKCGLENRGSDTLVCDIHGGLLRTRSFFPYFMLVAFEGGSIFRAFLLLLSCLLSWVLDYELQLRVMIFITFCGLKITDIESVGRAVLPKFYLENLHLQAYELLASTGTRIVFTSVPRVMVEGFLKEYLRVNKVMGTELHTVGSYFTGLLSNSGLLVKHRALKDYFGEKTPEIGLGSSSLRDRLFISLCKEAYVVYKEENKNSESSSVMTRDKYPKPLIFHDGKPLTAVTYSLSKMSEIIAPIRTVRLTRDRERDGETMQRLLSEGDLVVCPEGTTCREPYLLRFSSLFAELADEIVPVAVNTRVSMFYGTTASGLKCLDPIFFFMNPRPFYQIHILDKLPIELTCAGGRSSCEVANYIQRLLADALGFECTTLTRKDKYMMLAGNEGVVQGNNRKP